MKKTIQIVGLIALVIIAGCKDKADKFYDLGRHFEDQELYGQAVVEYQKALDQNPRHVKSQYRLGMACWSNSMKDEAVEAFNKTLELDPDHRGALAGLANAAYVKQDYETTRQLVDKLLKLDPKNVSARALLGGVYMNERDFAKAVKEFKTALESSPGDGALHYSLGYALFQDGGMDEIKEAVFHFNEAERLGMDVKKAREHMALALKERGLEIKDFEGADDKGEQGGKTVE